MTSTSKHFDLHVSGLAYVNRIREVKPKKGLPFWACALNAIHGDGTDPSFTQFDVIVRGELAQKRLQSLQDAVANKQKVFVAFKLGDIYPDIFEYQHGEKKGQTGVAIKGRLLQIGFTSIDGNPVDWAEIGLPDSPQVAIAA